MKLLFVAPYTTDHNGVRHYYAMWEARNGSLIVEEVSCPWKQDQTTAEDQAWIALTRSLKKMQWRVRRVCGRGSLSQFRSQFRAAQSDRLEGFKRELKWNPQLRRSLWRLPLIERTIDAQLALYQL